MKAKLEIKGNKLVVDIAELFYLLHEAYNDEFDAEEFINKLGWLPQVRKMVIETLKKEYSRKSYNPDIHKERDELLTAIKEKEVEYHTAYVAELIEEQRRWERNYWKLWRWYRDKLDQFNIKEFPPDTEKIDFDFREKVAKYIKSLLTEKENQQ